MLSWIPDLHCNSHRSRSFPLHAAEEKELHRSIGKAVAASGIDALFCAGTLAEEYASEAKANPECEVHYKKTREEMTEELLAYVKEGDTVLVKASHFMEFPKVVEALTKE